MGIKAREHNNRDVRVGSQRQEVAVLWIDLRQRNCSPRMIRVAKQRIPFLVWPMHSKDRYRFKGGGLRCSLHDFGGRRCLAEAPV